MKNNLLLQKDILEPFSGLNVSDLYSNDREEKIVKFKVDLNDLNFYAQKLDKIFGNHAYEASQYIYQHDFIEKNHSLVSTRINFKQVFYDFIENHDSDLYERLKLSPKEAQKVSQNLALELKECKNYRTQQKNVIKEALEAYQDNCPVTRIGKFFTFDFKSPSTGKKLTCAFTDWDQTDYQDNQFRLGIYDGDEVLFEGQEDHLKKLVTLPQDPILLDLGKQGIDVNYNDVFNFFSKELCNDNCYIANCAFQDRTVDYERFFEDDQYIQDHLLNVFEDQMLTSDLMNEFEEWFVQDPTPSLSNNSMSLDFAKYLRSFEFEKLTALNNAINNAVEKGQEPVDFYLTDYCDELTMKDALALKERLEKDLKSLDQKSEYNQEALKFGLDLLSQDKVEIQHLGKRNFVNFDFEGQKYTLVCTNERDFFDAIEFCSQEVTLLDQQGKPLLNYVDDEEQEFNKLGQSVPDPEQVKDLKQCYSELDKLVQDHSVARSR